LYKVFCIFTARDIDCQDKETITRCGATRSDPAKFLVVVDSATLKIMTSLDILRLSSPGDEKIVGLQSSRT
jgi:3-polyprenyl-4-hydroxybenzoate decarboxylase